MRPRRRSLYISTVFLEIKMAKTHRAYRCARKALELGVLELALIDRPHRPADFLTFTRRISILWVASVNTRILPANKEMRPFFGSTVLMGLFRHRREK